MSKSYTTKFITNLSEIICNIKFDTLGSSLN